MVSDTIAAVATPAGTGGVAVIRISGANAKDVLQRVFPRDDYVPGQMYYGSIKKDGQLLDICLLYTSKTHVSATAERFSSNVHWV